MNTGKDTLNPRRLAITVVSLLWVGRAECSQCIRRAAVIDQYEDGRRGANGPFVTYWNECPSDALPLRPRAGFGCRAWSH